MTGVFRVLSPPRVGQRFSRVFRPESRVAGRGGS
jgi:hypothetical protein